VNGTPSRHSLQTTHRKQPGWYDFPRACRICNKPRDRKNACERLIKVKIINTEIYIRKCYIFISASVSFFQAAHPKNELTGIERAAGINTYHLVPEK